MGRARVLLEASSHYGGATARLLALKGVKVGLGGRSRETLEALEEGIRTSGGRALVVGTHLAKRHHPAYLVRAALETFGGLDVLIFMAFASASPLGSLDLDAFERSVEVNVRGFLHTLAVALPIMPAGGGGHVVCLRTSRTRRRRTRCTRRAGRPYESSCRS